MNELILDFETTIKNKGNPFTVGNKVCYAVTKYVGQPAKVWDFLDTDCLKEFEEELNGASLIVGFNLKFDLHWLRNLLPDFRAQSIWDCQYAEFLFSRQQWRYPSLEDSLVRYGLGHKIDVVATEYWGKGIDTPDISKDVILEYTRVDGEMTEKLFLKQKELFANEEKGLYPLFRLHCADLLVLQEMEYNGILYDTESSLKEADLAEQAVAEIDQKLTDGYAGIPLDFNSRDHVSVYLYGGTIAVDTRVPVGVYKSGAKVGHTRYKIVTHKHDLPRLFEPLKGTELKKNGYFKTDEDTLSQLRGTKANKGRVSLLLDRAKLEKLRGTYYRGLPETIAEMVWAGNYLHSTLNQCVAVTGRLSSTKPNQQNFAPEVKRFCVSRYV